MAELLIRLKNNTHPDPAKDLMCYKRGDIVVVMENGHHWGQAEGFPDFAVIQTDRTVGQMEKFLVIHETPRVETRDIDAIEWHERKAKGDHGDFIKLPSESKHGNRYNKNKHRKVSTIMLTGKVMQPHTRRKWHVVVTMLPPAEMRSFNETGRAVIPFAQLRIAMRDKYTGAQA